ncbi:MAG: amylo-alpha-1,6-glucosidase [Deinococcaceae bacterium]
MGTLSNSSIPEGTVQSQTGEPILNQQQQRHTDHAMLITMHFTPQMLGPSTLGSLEQETLLADGLGGFYMMTACGVPTRTYHGWVRSRTPPVNRDLSWIMPLESVQTVGRSTEFYSYEMTPGYFVGKGIHRLSGCELEYGIPTQTYFDIGVHFKRTTAVLQDSGTLGYFYEISNATTCSLQLGGLFSARDMHAVRHKPPKFIYEHKDHGLHLQDEEGHHLHIQLYGLNRDIQWTNLREQQLYFRAEKERGEPCEDHVCESTLLREQLDPGHHRFALLISDAIFVGDPWEALHVEQERRKLIIQTAFQTSGLQDDVVATLTLAADAFLVQRASSGGHSVIAGYPWFTDWGRDTMIALSGLTLTTGRFGEARSVLSTFLKHVNVGLLPNHFSDDGTGAGYNTADATLWLFIALERYLDATNDTTYITEILPVLKGILEFHIAGTQFGIALDPTDGLLCAGEPNVQLTWMDVKIHDWVVTPRHGKAIEICALWINALAIFIRFSEATSNDPIFTEQCNTILKQAETSFSKFWDVENLCFYDYIDPSGTPNTQLRPNAIIALALPHTPSTSQQRQKTLDLARTHLVSPFGMYSLSPDDPQFKAKFTGSQLERDAAYHQGTVWAWPLASFLELLWKETHSKEEVLSYMQPTLNHLFEAGLGSISEVFEAESGQPKGCPFQAWSVAEFLRIYALACKPGTFETNMNSKQ